MPFPTPLTLSQSVCRSVLLHESVVFMRVPSPPPPPSPTAPLFYRLTTTALMARRSVSPPPAPRRLRGLAGPAARAALARPPPFYDSIQFSCREAWSGPDEQVVIERTPFLPTSSQFVFFLEFLDNSWEIHLAFSLS